MEVTDVVLLSLRFSPKETVPTTTELQAVLGCSFATAVLHCYIARRKVEDDFWIWSSIGGMSQTSCSYPGWIRARGQDLHLPICTLIFKDCMECTEIKETNFLSIWTSPSCLQQPQITHQCGLHHAALEGSACQLKGRSSGRRGAVPIHSGELRSRPQKCCFSNTGKIGCSDK